jgi:hypothetical protein
MPKIFDNIENQMLDGLGYTLEVSYKADFCVGYFNLRGWKQIADKVEPWIGGEDHQCRLLIGMQRRPEELVRELFSKKEPELIDQGTVTKLRKALAQDFRDQLTVGIPTEEDEIGLRKLASELKSKKVVAKLFLRHPLHAKLYLLFRDDKVAPVIGYVGSSNLTLAGLKKQGELNVDVVEQDAAQKLADWFKDRWEDRWCVDISEEFGPDHRAPDELIIEIVIPRVPSGAKCDYKKHRVRSSVDFPMVSLATLFEFDKDRGTFSEVRIVLGAVASWPVRVVAAEESLKGKVPGKEVAEQAAALAVERAIPLAGNRYKVEIVKALIRRSIMSAIG